MTRLISFGDYFNPFIDQVYFYIIIRSSFLIIFVIIITSISFQQLYFYFLLFTLFTNFLLISICDLNLYLSSRNYLKFPQLSCKCTIKPLVAFTTLAPPPPKITNHQSLLYIHQRSHRRQQCLLTTYFFPDKVIFFLTNSMGLTSSLDVVSMDTTSRPYVVSMDTTSRPHVSPMHHRICLKNLPRQNFVLVEILCSSVVLVVGADGKDER